VSKKRHTYAENLALGLLSQILHIEDNCPDALPGQVLKHIKEANKILKKRRKAVEKAS
jgi:hypothetical protein